MIINLEPLQMLSSISAIIMFKTIRMTANKKQSFIKTLFMSRILEKWKVLVRVTSSFYVVLQCKKKNVQSIMNTLKRMNKIVALIYDKMFHLLWVNITSDPRDIEKSCKGISCCTRC